MAFRLICQWQWPKAILFRLLSASVSVAHPHRIIMSGDRFCLLPPGCFRLGVLAPDPPAADLFTDPAGSHLSGCRFQNGQSGTASATAAAAPAA